MKERDESRKNKDVREIFMSSKNTSPPNDKEPTLLRDILKLRPDILQKDLAEALEISEPLLSYWCANSTAAAAHLGSILKYIDIDAKELIKIIKKHLQ
jgi:hypothetical protein